VENFVGNVIDDFRLFEENLRFCRVFEGINLITPLPSYAYTSSRYGAAKRSLRHIGASKSHICTDLGAKGYE
jgi:hypothetical protein